MKIIILGAGQVGRTAAYHLAKEEANDVTVVDLREDILRDLRDRLDIRTVIGHGSHPDVLERAGIKDADMIIALTDSDETNMIACQVAATLFRTPTKVARIRAAEYLNRDRLFGDDALPVDVRISPEELVTEYIEQLIRYPGALQVLDFAKGEIRLVGARADKDGLLVGQKLSALREHIPNVDARVAAIYRDGKAIKPSGDTVIKEGDEVFFIAARADIRAVMSEMRKLDEPVRRIIIAGGGNIGFRLAKAMEQTNQVKLIEKDQETAKAISEKLDRTIVLHGDATDEELLMEENVDNADVFCALTNSEEANIMAAMLAKKLGAHKVMALINRPSYAELSEDAGTIDIAISPQQVTIGTLLAKVRRGDVARVHSLRRGAAEALEAVAHGSRENSNVVGRAVEEIDLPDSVTIGAIVRDEQVLMAHHDTVIEEDDHIILFLTDRSHVEAVEKLFQVDATYV
jgi:trk system potassium uptake protein TrkA